MIEIVYRKRMRKTSLRPPLIERRSELLLNG
jgi:hypothetical protein